MDDAEGAEIWEVKTLSEHLSADDNIVSAVMNGLVNLVELFFAVRIGIKAANLGAREEFFEFFLEEFSAETLMMNAGIFALWTSGWNRGGMTASMAAEFIVVGMEDEWQAAARTEGLPATFIADGHRGGAATIMENEALFAGIKRLLDRFN